MPYIHICRIIRLVYDLGGGVSNFRNLGMAYMYLAKVGAVKHNASVSRDGYIKSTHYSHVNQSRVVE